MEIFGIVIFVLGAGYTAYQLHRDRFALNADRRAVWKRAEEIPALREEQSTKRMELNQGFDWKANLPMILSFLNGKVINVYELDMDAIQNLLTEEKK